jgi:hypothetical protein
MHWAAHCSTKYKAWHPTISTIVAVNCYEYMPAARGDVNGVDWQCQLAVSIGYFNIMRRKLEALIECKTVPPDEQNRAKIYL